MKLTVRERLYARVVEDPETGCLLWQGALKQGGYGLIKVGAKTFLVHRVAWELDYGPIPDGLTIDHVYARGCRHRNCVSVAHLEPVTLQENSARAGRLSHRGNHCRRGHEFDLLNTRFWRDKRLCRACDRIRSQAARAARAARQAS